MSIVKIKKYFLYNTSAMNERDNYELESQRRMNDFFVGTWIRVISPILQAGKMSLEQMVRTADVVHSLMQDELNFSYSHRTWIVMALLESMLKNPELHSQFSVLCVTSGITAEEIYKTDERLSLYSKIQQVFEKYSSVHDPNISYSQ